MGWCFMKKLENFKGSLAVLAGADFARAKADEIYRTGIIGQFNLTFELSWKALQEVLRLHGVGEAATGSPREILQAGFRVGFLDNDAVWLQMLRQRNLSTHIYKEDEANRMISLVEGTFLPAFEVLCETLEEKLTEISAEENGSR